MQAGLPTNPLKKLPTGRASVGVHCDPSDTGWVEFAVQHGREIHLDLLAEVGVAARFRPTMV